MRGRGWCCQQGSANPKVEGICWIRSVRWCSLNRLSFLFCEYVVEQRQVVEFREIGHLPAEESVIEGLLRCAHESAVQRIVGDLQAREGFIENSDREGFAGLMLDLCIQEFFCFGGVRVDPVGKFNVGANPVSDEIGMRIQELRVHNEKSD